MTRKVICAFCAAPGSARYIFSRHEFHRGWMIGVFGEGQYFLAFCMVSHMDQLRQRRRTPRYAFPAVHWIAPIKGDERPTPADFIPVRCRDISRSGFSFWLEEPPDFRELVARIQHGTEILYVKAEVIHVTRPADGSTPGVVVGCRFEERISG